MSLRLDLPDRSVRILVLDSHAASRIGLGVVLRRQRWVDRCLLASNRDEAVMLTRRLKPDAAIVDISNVGPFVASYLAPFRAAHSANCFGRDARRSKPARRAAADKSDGYRDAARSMELARVAAG